MEGPTIVTLRDLAAEVGLPPPEVKVLAIVNGVRFDVLGRYWVFGGDAVAKMRKIAVDYRQKATAAGVKPRRPRSAKPEPVTA